MQEKESLWRRIDEDTWLFGLILFLMVTVFALAYGAIQRDSQSERKGTQVEARTTHGGIEVDRNADSVAPQKTSPFSKDSSRRN